MSRTRTATGTAHSRQTLREEYKGRQGQSHRARRDLGARAEIDQALAEMAERYDEVPFNWDCVTSGDYFA